MSLLVKITLSAALILSIAVPFGAFAAGEKTKGRYKTALAANVFLFFGTMVFAAVVMFSGNAAAAETGAQAAGSSAAGMGDPASRFIRGRHGLSVGSTGHRTFLSGRRHRCFRSSQRGTGGYQRGQLHPW